MDIITKSANETQELGEKVGDILISNSKFLISNEKARVLALSGDLGSGKTTFVQGLAKGLNISARILSPTFILLRRYQLAKGSLYHIDLYRLEGNVGNELEGLGFSEIVSDPGNIVVIEWAEKAKELMPDGTYWLEFRTVADTERKLLVPDKLLEEK